MGLDQTDVAIVRRHIEAAKAKPTEAERVAFNEGVVCASLALGAYIDAHGTTNVEAAKVLERAYHAILGVKDRTKLNAPGNA